MNSAIWNGLIPGGKSLKRGRQAVFFTTVNPMDDEKSMGETPRDLTKPRIAPYKNTWTRLQNNWESSMNENSRQALPKGSIDFKSATGCIQSEFRNTVNKTHQAKTQDHLETHQAIRSVTWKLVATSWITEFRVYLSLQSSSRKQHVRTMSRSWSRSVRTTSIRNPSFKTWARRRRSTSSAKNRRIWSSTWTTPRSSSFANTLPKNDAPIAIPTGKSALSMAVVEEIWKFRRDQSRCQTRTFSTTKNVPQGSRNAAKKLVKKSTEAIHLYLHDGTTATSTEIRCHSLGGPSRI